MTWHCRVDACTPRHTGQSPVSGSGRQSGRLSLVADRLTSARRRPLTLTRFVRTLAEERGGFMRGAELTQETAA